MTNEGDATLLKNNKNYRGEKKPLQASKGLGNLPGEFAWGSVHSSKVWKTDCLCWCPAEPNPCGEDLLYFWSKHRVQEATSTDFFFI